MMLAPQSKGKQMRLQFFSKRKAVRYLKARRISGATFAKRGKRIIVTLPTLATAHKPITGPYRLRDSLRQFDMAVPLSPRSPDARGQLGTVGRKLSECKYGFAYAPDQL